MTEEPLSIKLVVVGDGSVGKTCLLISYTQDRFPEEYVPTVFENYAATVKVDNQLVNLGLWDTAGQEEYERLRPLAYTNSDIFLIVFSVVEPSSFLNARKKWYPELQESVVSITPKIFVGNKIDLRDDRQGEKNSKFVARENARKIISEEFQCEYMECSALTQDGLKQIFDEAMRIVMNKKRKPMIKKQDSSSSFCNLI